MDFLTHLVFWHWFAFAVLLAILDIIFGANFLFVWCGLSAALVGLLKLIIPSLGWEYQLLVFGLGVLASIVIWRKVLKNKQHATDEPFLNRRARQYIGHPLTGNVSIDNIILSHKLSIFHG